MHSPSAENMFRRWLANLPSEKLCWMARSPIHAINKILAYASVYPAKTLVAWKGARPLVLYFHMHCTQEAERCIVYSQKIGEIRPSPGTQWDSSQKRESKKNQNKTQTPNHQKPSQQTRQGMFLH